MKSLYSKTGRRETVRLVNSTYPATRKIKEKFICGLRGACRSLYRWRASVMPPKQNERREVRTFTKKQSKRCPDHLNQEPRRKQQLGDGVPRLFVCAPSLCTVSGARGCGWPAPARCCCRSNRPFSFFFISSFSSSSSLQSRQQGLRTP